MNTNPFDKNNPLHAGNQVKLRLKLSDTKPYICSCGGKIFTENMFFRTVSSLITGNREEQLTPIPVVCCVSCNKPIAQLLPDELQEELKTIDVTSTIIVQ